MMHLKKEDSIKEKLHELMVRIAMHDILVYVGNFNAAIGSSIEEFGACVMVGG